PDSIAIRTQIIAAGLGIVADTLAASPVRDGTAKGAVVVTDGGLLPVPDGVLRNAPAPRIGALPPGPTGFLPVVSVRTTAPLVAVASVTPSAAAAPAADPATAATPVPTTSIV